MQFENVPGDVAHGDTMNSFPVPNVLISPKGSEKSEEKDSHGRVRSFPHERGQWVVHIFTPLDPLLFVDFTDEINDSTIIQAIEHPHLSWIHGHYITRYHQMGPFVARLSKLLSLIRPFEVCLSSFTAFENAEKSRVFLCIRESELSSSNRNANLKTFFSSIQQALMEFCTSVGGVEEKQEEFVIHSSLAAAAYEEKATMDALVNSISESMDEAVVVKVDNVTVKVGNKLYHLKL